MNNWITTDFEPQLIAKADSMPQANAPRYSRRFNFKTVSLFHLSEFRLFTGHDTSDFGHNKVSTLTVSQLGNTCFLLRILTVTDSLFFDNRVAMKVADANRVKNIFEKSGDKFKCRMESCTVGVHETNNSRTRSLSLLNPKTETNWNASCHVDKK